MKELNIIMYENQKTQANDFFNWLKNRNELKNIVFKITWFEMKAVPELKAGLHAPIKFEQRMKKRGELIEITYNKIKRNTSDKETYYQSEFDAAILDIYGTPHAPHGELFAEWLEHARFLGPVILVSAYDTPSRLFPKLPGLMRISRIETDENEFQWMEDVLTYLGYWLPFVDSLKPNVNHLGFPPDELLNIFFKQYGGKGQEVQKLKYLWIRKPVNSDNELQRRIKKFFVIDGFLNDLPGMKSIYGNNTASDLKAIASSLRLATVKDSSKPDIIFIETDNVDADGLNHIYMSITEPASQDGRRVEKISKRPLVCIIGDRFKDLSLSDYKKYIEGFGFIVIPKQAFIPPGEENEIYSNPAVWAKDCMEKLIYNILVCNIYTKKILSERTNTSERKDKWIFENLNLIDNRTYFEMLKRMVYSYLNVILFARSSSTLYNNESDKPTLIDWLGDSSLVQRGLNSTLIQHQLSKIVNALIDKGMIDMRYCSLLGIQRKSVNGTRL